MGRSYPDPAPLVVARGRAGTTDRLPSRRSPSPRRRKTTSHPSSRSPCPPTRPTGRKSTGVPLKESARRRPVSFRSVGSRGRIIMSRRRAAKNIRRIRFPSGLGKARFRLVAEGGLPGRQRSPFQSSEIHTMVPDGVLSKRVTRSSSSRWMQPCDPGWPTRSCLPVPWM